MSIKQIFSILLLALWLSATVSAYGQARIELSEARSLRSEPVDIIIEGLRPWSRVTLRLSTAIEVGDFADGVYASEAHFQAGPDGRIEVSKQASLGGDYLGVDPFGLFWSMQLDDESVAVDADTKEESAKDADPAALPEPRQYELSVLAGSEVLASRTFERIAVTEGVTTRRLDEGRLRGVLWLPPGDGPHPALIVLGGSGGGYTHRDAHYLVNHGYAALSLAYFGVEDLPEHLVEIPLESFSEGIDWLTDQPEIDATRLGVNGVSRGGELSLLLASIEHRLKAVVAWTPSHVSWAGCCGPETRSQASWTHQGEGIPFAGASAVADDRWSYWPSQVEDNEVTVLNYFWFGLANEAVADRAVIQVENTQGAIMLITGAKDETWPASYMADQIMKRLTANDFEHPFVHVQFDNAGHVLGAFPDDPVSRHHAFPVEGVAFLYRFGGDQDAMIHERRESWRLVERFLEENL